MLSTVYSIINVLSYATALFDEEGDYIYSNEKYNNLVIKTFSNYQQNLKILIGSERFSHKVEEITVKGYEDKLYFVTLEEVKASISQDNILKDAFNAGVAENALGTLHNIGNVLTILKSEASSQEDIEAMDVSILVMKKIYTMVSTYRKEGYLADSSVLSLIAQLINTLQKSGKNIKDKLDKIDQNTSQIADIIRTQQKYSNQNGVQREVNLKDMVDDCIRLSVQNATKRAVDIKVKISPFLDVYVDMVSTAQIITNLIKNSIEAIGQRMRIDPLLDQPKIVINTDKTDRGIDLVISDNGIGIEPSVQDKIFTFGFSTKERGSGFGLHHCYLLTKKAGGTLSIESDGLNRGAQVSLGMRVCE